MKSLSIILICTFSFFFLLSGDAQGQLTVHGNLSGKVVDANTREPLPGVNIILVGTVMGTTSDLEGNFHLSRIPAGTYDIKATMMGYQSQTLGCLIRAGESTEINFNLKETVIETPALVVTAGKKSQSFQEVPNSVSLVTAREIERKNKTYLDEVLQYAPGVNLMQGQVNIRGSSGFTLGAGSRVLLLVDGVPMMPGDSGDIKWDLLPLSQIDRVEIVKGAGSALYGSFALGGVINIITKDPSPVPRTEVRFSAGIYDKPYYPEWRWTNRTLNFNQTDVSHSRTWSNLSLLLSAGHRESTGYKQGTYYHRWNLLGKLDYKFNTQSRMWLQSSWSSDRRGETFLWKNQHDVLKIPFNATGNETESYKFNLNSVYRQVLSKSLTCKVRGSYFRNRWQHYYQDNSDFSRAQKFGLEVQTDFLPSPVHAITAGIEGIYDWVHSSMFGDHDSWTWAGYIQDEMRLMEPLSVTLGIRYDYHIVDGGMADTQVNPKIGVSFRPTILTTIRASVGRGFRAPTIAELFTSTNTSGFRVIPNLTLKAERAWSTEIGLNQILSEHLLLDVAAFSSDYWDLIEPEPDMLGVIQFVNVTRARIQGIEVQGITSWWHRRISATVSYTYMAPEDVSTGKTLSYRPQHLLVLSLTTSYGLLEAGLDYRYVSRIDSVKVYPMDDRVAQKVLDGRISAKLNRFTLAFNVDNMLQYNYTQVERNLAPMRSYVLTVSSTF